MLKWETFFFIVIHLWKYSIKFNEIIKNKFEKKNNHEVNSENNYAQEYKVNKNSK